MRFSQVSIVALSFVAGGVSGFKGTFTGVPNTRRSSAPSVVAFCDTTTPTALSAYRQSYQHVLDQMTAGEIEASILDIDKEIAQAQEKENQANTNVDILEQQLATLQAEHTIAVDKLKEDMEEDHVQLVEAQEAAMKSSDTVSMLEMELRLKEQEKRTVVKKLQDQMKKQESDLKQQMNDLGDDMAHMKIDFQHEKLELEEKFKAHDVELHNEMESLEKQLEHEREMASKAASAVQAVRDEMKKKEKSLKQQINDMGSDLTNMKIEVNQEKMALMDQYKHRETDFVTKVQSLTTQLEAEKENASTAKELSNGLTVARVELESDLVEMKRKYEAEKWRREFDATQAQDEIDGLKKEMEEAEKVKEEAEKLKEEIAALKEERKDPMALFGRAFTVLTGQAEDD